MPALLKAAAGVAICLLLAACGGGGGELSKAEFIEQANSICVHARERMSERLDDDPSSRVGKSGQPGRLYEATADALRTEAAEISALEAPSGDADEIEEIAKSAREVATTIEGNKDVLVQKEVDKAEKEMLEAEQLATAYGLASCLLS